MQKTSLISSSLQIKKEKSIQERYTTSETVFDFNTLKPASYLIQIIEDENANKIYDTGNYLEKRQPEKVIHFGEDIEVNAPVGLL